MMTPWRAVRPWQAAEVMTRPWNSWKLVRVTLCLQRHRHGADVPGSTNTNPAKKQFQAQPGYKAVASLEPYMATSTALHTGPFQAQPGSKPLPRWVNQLRCQLGRSRPNLAQSRCLAGTVRMACI